MITLNPVVLRPRTQWENPIDLAMGLTAGTDFLLNSLKANEQALQQFYGAEPLPTWVQDTLDYIPTIINKEAEAEFLQAQLGNGLFDNIRVLETMQELQNPPPSMIPYILAEPTLFQYAEMGIIEAWKDSVEPLSEADRHLNWIAVNDGVLKVNDEGELVSSSFITSREFKPLSIYQSQAILKTWGRYLEKIDERGFDPTSPFNNLL